MLKKEDIPIIRHPVWIISEESHISHHQPPKHKFNTHAAEGLGLDTEGSSRVCYVVPTV